MPKPGEHKKEQAEKGIDALTYFVYRSLPDAEVEGAETVSEKIKTASSELIWLEKWPDAP